MFRLFISNKCFQNSVPRFALCVTRSRPFHIIPSFSVDSDDIAIFDK